MTPTIIFNNPVFSNTEKHNGEASLENKATIILPQFGYSLNSILLHFNSN